MSLLASGRLTANTVTAIYTTPTSRRAVINVNVCNTGAAARVRLAIASDETAPADTAANWIEWDVPLAASEVIERTGIVLSAGQRVWARADTAAVTVNVWGIEEIA